MNNPMLEVLLARCGGHTGHDAAGHAVLIDAASGRTRSAAAFWAGVQAAALRLREHGVRPGDLVAVTVPLSETFMHVVFGCFAAGAAPALLDPGSDPHVAAAAVRRLRPRLWLTATGDEDGAIAAGELWTDGDVSPEGGFEPVEVAPEHPCMVIHTSGTTGEPKAVTWTCANVRSQLDQQRSYDPHGRLRTEFVNVSWVALWAMGADRCSILPAAGPAGPSLVDVAAIVEQMHAHGCDYTFASMALWRRILTHCRDNDLPMPPVQVAATSGAPVNLSVLADLVDHLPAARVDVLYASTEAPPPLAVLDARALVEATDACVRQGRGIPVGHPMPDTRVAIINPATPAPSVTDDDLLPPGRPGEVIVSGPRVTTDYLNRPDLTRAAKLHHPNGTLWHRMGDIGYLDHTGMLWFLCRKKHLIDTPDGWIFPDQQEHVYAYRTGAYQCVLTRPNPSSGFYLVLPDGAPAASQHQISLIAEEMGFPRPRLLRHPGPFPVDSRHHSKIDRAAVAAWVLTETGN
ncbi:AMP-binding protein [Nonomuraea typhae]|uniref:AMP-binding protein n=1 Tax=Nonomuraea typhae TaxID=2603600 RepID=A0ABW7ZCI1_9ACTN